MSKLRITIAEGDHHDIELLPFDKISTRDFIRIAETDDTEGTSDLSKEKATLIRVTNAPERFIRYMTDEELGLAYQYVTEVLQSSNDHSRKLGQVQETLDKWEQEHGTMWTMADAKDVLTDFGIFRPSITVHAGTDNEETFDARPLNNTIYGQWIDLEATVHDMQDRPESELYVRALSTLMHGQDGRYPVQGRDEEDEEYDQRRTIYTQRRNALFMGAPWVDVMGCAAFFFFNEQRFAEITARSMTRFRNLSGRNWNAGQRIIPEGGVSIQS